ncbi:hypothetical protein Emag_006642 [Eimeria magna]
MVACTHPLYRAQLRRGAPKGPSPQQWRGPLLPALRVDAGCLGSAPRTEGPPSSASPPIAAAARRPAAAGVAAAAAAAVFGSKFRSYAVPEWQRHYVDYQGLKTVLKQQQKRLEASRARPSTYLTKLLLARWDASFENRHAGASPQALPLPALMGPPGSRVVPTRGGPSPITGGVGAPQEENVGSRWSRPNKQSRGREASVLAEPLLQQQEEQEQHEQAEYRSDGETASGRGGGVFGGVAEGEPERGKASLQAECLEEFDAAVEREKRKVAAFFKEELGFLEDKLRAVSAELKAFNASRRRRVSLREGADAPDTPSGAQKNKRNRADEAAVAAPPGAAAACFLENRETSSEDAAYLRRLERILLLLLDTLDKLEVYRRLNLLAFWKALKKRDKQLGLEAGKALKDFDGITAFFKQELRIPPKTRRLARNLYRQVAGEDSDLPLDVFPLRTAEGLSVRLQTRWRQAASSLHACSYGWSPVKRVRANDLTRGGVGRGTTSVCMHACTHASQMGQFHQEARVWFLAGCLAVLLLLTMSLLSLPMPPSTSFDYGGLMAVFPLFRLAFAWSFVWLSTASAMAIMERYGVNYRCVHTLRCVRKPCTTPHCLRSRGAEPPSLLGMAPAALPTVLPPPPRCVYLLLRGSLFTCSFLLDLAPRGQASSISFFSFAALHFVATTGTVALYLADSKLRLLGNHQIPKCLSTFLALRPPVNLGAVVSPLSVGAAAAASNFPAHPFSVFAVGDVKLVANIIGDVLTSLAKPLGDFQYLQRFGFKRPRAVLRLDLGVSVYAMCLLWVFSYALGSLFMLYWDVRVDWGLLPTPDRFVRMQGRLMYPPWLYGAIAVTNVMGRLTWAMTLMPISIVGNKSLSGNLVLLFISVIEILRRGAGYPMGGSLTSDTPLSACTNGCVVSASNLFDSLRMLGAVRLSAVISGLLHACRPVQVPPLHQTRLEMLEGDPLMQTASVSACQLPSEASSRRSINQGDPGGPSSALSVLA